MAKKKIGRPDKYDTHVKPYLNKIKKLVLTMTEEQIAQTLGISYSAFRKYKTMHPELEDALVIGKRELVAELKSILIDKARGYTYDETETITEAGKPVKTKTVTKTALPDTASINLLLKNLDKENWANDPQMIEIRKAELEFKKKQFDSNNW